MKAEAQDEGKPAVRAGAVRAELGDGPGGEVQSSGSAWPTAQVPAGAWGGDARG